jgi:2-polyprenyl-3-methyl-5-hydroxy-6-metoxy-1,4-benzoquinol methylase
MECRICLNSCDNKAFEFSEMMFGYRDRFDYFQCSRCGCLQITDFPADLSKYYPAQYYSFSEINNINNRIKLLLKRLRNNYAILNKGVLGKLINLKYPFPFQYEYFPLSEDDAIMDVGCGNGSLLYELSISNLHNMIGVDPYIYGDIIYSNNLKIIKKYITDVEGKWNLIMFHHSFEHIPNPAETIEHVSKLLVKGGVCLLRIPTVSSYAWEHYRENWVQLDAPRHFYLHSVESIKRLADKAHLNLERVIYDSGPLQFWGSEQYIKGIPLESEQSYNVNPSKSIFSDADIRHFERAARKLNLESRGDQAAFYLRKTGG